MRIDYRGWFFIAGGLAALAALIFWAFYHDTDFDEETTPFIGQVVEVSGSTDTSNPGASQNRRMSVGDKLHDGDVVQTHIDATSTFLLTNKTRVRIGQSSRVKFEIWNPTVADSPILIVLEQGQVDLKETARGKVFVVDDGELKPGLNVYYSSEGFNVTPELSKTFNSTSPREMTAPAESKKPNPPPELPELPKSLPEKVLPSGVSLSNDFIRSRLDERLDEFERCRLNRVRSAGPVIGELQFGFTIHPDGKVKDVKVLNSTVPDSNVIECARKALAETTFPVFAGQKIQLQYPIAYR